MSDIVVLHYQDHSSNKIWAIDTTKNQTGKYSVWYGKRDTRLRHDEVPADPGWEKRIQQKEAKGYERLYAYTIDTETKLMVLRPEELEEVAIPSSLWYRASSKIRKLELAVFLGDTVQNLRDYDSHEADCLESLPIYKALMNGDMNSGADYEEGPLAILLLYAIRRHFQHDAEHLFNGGDLFQISDDSNCMLPDRFDDIGEYISESCKALFIKRGWMSEGENFLNVAEHVNKQHYTTVIAIKPLATALGCIEAPVDFSVIQTEIRAAFF